MKKNNPIIVFILGVLTVVAIIPVFSSLGELICQWIEDGKAVAIEKTTKRNIKITKLQKEVEKEQCAESGSAIGYEIPNDCEVYGDYCNSKKKKRKIGF